VNEALIPALEMTMALEQEHDIKFVFLALAGSRARQTHTPQSDYDVTGWFVQPPHRYLTLDSPGLEFIGPLRRDIPLDGGVVIEFNARDLRKVCTLAHSSNPNVTELLSAPPETWWMTSPSVEWIRRLVRSQFSPRTLAYHYASFASGRYKEIAQRNPVGVKHIGHILHALYSGMWLYSYNDLPPVPFADLVGAVGTPNQAVRDAIELCQARTAEGGTTVWDAKLARWILHEVDTLRQFASRTLDRRPDEKLLRALWLSAVEEQYGPTFAVRQGATLPAGFAGVVGRGGA
jgi:predicted nucleotidyltransferase